MNNSQQFSPELFEPASVRESLEGAAQPAAPFWSAVLRRLRRDVRAVFSLLIIVLLLLAALFGPLLWRLDPAQQILGAAAQGSMVAQRALLIRSSEFTPLIEISDNALRRYARERKVSFPVLRDTAKMVFLQFSPRVRLPMIVILNKDGRVELPVQFGMRTPAESYKADLRARLNKLLSVPSESDR